MSSSASSAASALPGAPFVAYGAGQLQVEQVTLSELAQQHGTPLFVYSQASILAALAAYQRGLAGRNALICYAMKANSSLAILRLLADAGCGFDIVSVGELERALAAGATPSKISSCPSGHIRISVARNWAVRGSDAPRASSSDQVRVMACMKSRPFGVSAQSAV